MQLGRPAVQTWKRVILLVMLFLALLFIIYFWDEIRWLFSVLFNIPHNLPAGEKDVLAVIKLFFKVIFESFLLVFAVWVVMISFQALLPVSDLLKQPLQSILDVYRTSFHLLLYMFHAHGPAIFVKDGKANDTTEDLKRENWPGVVVIDFNSAAVLEERNGPPGLPGLFLGLLMALLESLSLMDRKESPRVRGAGIVFTRPRERIRGTVDLRNQARGQDKVQCYTRDGIELSAKVTAGFTVGQPPEVLQVTYTGDRCKENLSVVTLEETNGQVRVSKFNDDYNELDASDRKEIQEYAESLSSPGHMHVPYPYTALPKPPNQVQFDPERVINAVFAQARNGKQDTLHWTDLPTQVAAGIYREVLSQVNYDQLYEVKDSGKLYLDDFKAKVKFAMRNNGILSFRLVLTSSGKPLVKGRLYRPDELLVSPVMPLTNSKVLRDRGIKVLGSGFGNPTPVSDAIYKQRLDNWRAVWERDLDISSAAHEREAMHERARAYAEAQREMWLNLSQLFENREYGDEAVVLRVLEAIESMAEDPKTRALLPDNTLRLLLNLDRMMLPSPSNAQALGPTDFSGISTGSPSNGGAR